MNPVALANKTQAEQHRFLAAVLSNDEASTDEELRQHFVASGIGLSVANEYIAERNAFLDERIW